MLHFVDHTAVFLFEVTVGLVLITVFSPVVTYEDLFYVADWFVVLFYEQPMLCVSAVNPYLYFRVPILVHLRETRKRLSKMLACIRCPSRSRIQGMVGSRRYLLESNDFYALRDLTDLSKGAFAGKCAITFHSNFIVLFHICTSLVASRFGMRGTKLQKIRQAKLVYLLNPSLPQSALLENSAGYSRGTERVENLLFYCASRLGYACFSLE